MALIRIIHLLCLWFFMFSMSYAYSVGQSGNIVTYAIPLSSVSAALLLKDYQGLKQMALANGLVQGATEGLKLAVNERRPNGGCCSSFPSRHASLAFTGAAFMQFRYGLQYSIPFYVGSAYVAYSRVKTKAHYWQDVVFGGALGIAGAYFSTTPYKGQNLTMVLNGKYAGIIYRKWFD
jgi:membrane-associated phospholipid phosphatase